MSAGTSHVDRTPRTTSPADALARARKTCRVKAMAKAAPKLQIKTRAPRVAVTTSRGPGTSGSGVARCEGACALGSAANASDRYFGRRRNAKCAAIAVVQEAKVAKRVGTQIDAGATEPAPARTVKVPRGSR